MRRIPLVVIVGLLASVPVLAQRGGMRGGALGRGPGAAGIRFNGGFNAFRGGFFRQPGFRGSLGFRRFSGFAFSYPFYFPPSYAGYGFYNPSYSGYYPDAYGDASAGYSYSGPEVVVVQSPPDRYPAPPAPAFREYASPPQPEASYEPPLYLIAFQDGTIRAALAYWAEGSTVHYVSMDHDQKQSPLASVDRELSERLNHERNVTFRLPR
jgi:hypothetical protein